MSAPTRKLHTEGSQEIRFRGPYEKIRELAAYARSLGLDIEPQEPSVPWREAIPDVTDEQLPGVCLRGARYREGVTQRQLSEMTGIPQRHISEMEHGKRPIGKKNAMLFAKALNTTYKVFL